MKKTNLLTILVLSASIIFSGCASMSNTGKGAAIGAGGGAALGAGIGALVGKGKGAAIGAAVGRAEAVANFLVGNGIARNRITTEGLAFDQPVADNSTAEGRAKNRRVEVYITASANMIKQAEEGTLK